MEPSSIYRKSSVERISSPEQLNDYLRVTNPSVWIVLAAVVLLLAGMLVWGALTYIGSVADGSATVERGVMLVRFEDETLAKNVEAGMTVTVGDAAAVIASVGYDENGAVFALAETTLPDGAYHASVRYKQTQVLKLLFN